MSGMDASIAGMSTAARRLAVSAHNVANSQTEGFRAQRAINGETTGGGVEVVEIRDTPAVPEVSEGVVRSNVDLTTEVTNQIIDRTSYTVNAKMLRAQDDVTGSLLDIID